MRWLAAALLLAACGGDDASSTVDAMPELDAPPPAFVGTWRVIPVNPQPVEERAILTVGADHSFVTVANGNADEATWALDDDGRLAITADGSTSHSEFYVDDEHFARDAAFPVGAVDGVVGTWTGTLNTGTMTIDLAADLTATIAYGPNPGFVGTYTVEGNSIFMTGTLGGSPSSLYAQVLPDVVIGTPLYERLPD